jgi:hypothetical protein
MRTSSKQHAFPLTSDAGKAVALAERIIADAKSGAFRGIAVAYVSAHGPEEIHASNAIWFDQTDRIAALVLANQLLELVKPSLNVAPDAPLSASRAN